eukprot:gene10326-10132_t
MGVRNVAFGVTLFLTVLALFSVATKGMNWGLDFTGGTLIELTYERPADVTKVREQLVTAGYHEAIVQNFGATTDLLVRMPGEDPQLGHQVAEALQKVGGENPATVKRVEFVGPQVGEELRDQGGLGMLMALGGILIYLAFRFQWKFAVGAIVSLIHDVIVTIGILSFFQITFDLTVLAAVLAIIGYSLNDTIVVFDRVRENFRVLRKASLIENINISTTQTLLRTMATSISTLLAIAALLFFGGDNLFGFSIALFIGVLAGTYSSIYIANVVLIWLNLSSEDLIPAANTEKESMLVGAVLGAVGVTAGGAVATYSLVKDTGPEYAQVLAVEPVKTQIKTPREVCKDVAVTRQAPVKDQHQIAGTVVGALAGGLLGNQIGGGTGKKIATVAGAVGGGYAGNKVQEGMQERDTYTTTQTRCNTVNDISDKVVGYDVRYSLDGKEGKVRMDRDPGNQIPVDKEGKLILSENQQAH